MIIKRIFDFACATLGLIFLAPIFLLIALVIKLDSAGAIFFRQERIGQFGAPFKIHKFRTMVASSTTTGLQLTTMNDARITRTGHWLRKYKLDELAQLIDVVRGEMSLVGPRPEVPRYAALYPEDAKKIIFSVRPGITDIASIQFRNENDILAKSDDPERDYIEKILPIKIELCKKYVSERSFWLDLVLILKTIRAII